MRLAAISALVAAFLVFLVIVVASLAGGDSAPQGTGAPAERQGKASKAKQRKVYVVKPNDCCLSEIADKTGIELEVLQQLNPGLDPQTIHSGDRVKLR